MVVIPLTKQTQVLGERPYNCYKLTERERDRERGGGEIERERGGETERKRESEFNSSDMLTFTV